MPTSPSPLLQQRARRNKLVKTWSEQAGISPIMASACAQHIRKLAYQDLKEHGKFCLPGVCTVKEVRRRGGMVIRLLGKPYRKKSLGSRAPIDLGPILGTLGRNHGRKFKARASKILTRAATVKDHEENPRYGLESDEEGGSYIGGSYIMPYSCEEPSHPWPRDEQDLFDLLED